MPTFCSIVLLDFISHFWWPDLIVSIHALFMYKINFCMILMWCKIKYFMFKYHLFPFVNVPLWLNTGPPSNICLEPPLHVSNLRDFLSAAKRSASSDRLRPVKETETCWKKASRLAVRHQAAPLASTARRSFRRTKEPFVLLGETNESSWWDALCFI